MEQTTKDLLFSFVRQYSDHLYALGGQDPTTGPAPQQQVLTDQYYNALCLVLGCTAAASTDFAWGNADLSDLMPTPRVMELACGTAGDQLYALLAATAR